MSHWPLLSLVTCLQLVGTAFILMARGDEAVVARNARWIALWTSLIVFVLSLVLWFDFDPSTADFQFVERASWVTLGGFDTHYTELSRHVCAECALRHVEHPQPREREARFVQPGARAARVPDSYLLASRVLVGGAQRE